MDFFLKKKDFGERCTRFLGVKCPSVKNVTDRPPVHTKTAHFCRHILKKVDAEN